MALGNDGIPPTRGELWLRFVFGAIFGMFAAVGLDIELLDRASVREVVLTAIVGGLAAGLMARHYGDQFWMNLRKWQ